MLLKSPDVFGFCRSISEYYLSLKDKVFLGVFGLFHIYSATVYVKGYTSKSPLHK
jgi:hypothetical protein